jgi:hypothetical protein
VNSFELMHALGGASEDFVEEALSEPLNGEQPVADVQFSGGSGESAPVTHRLLLTVISAAACLAIAVGLGAVIWRLNRPGISPEISANTSQTEPADSGLDGDTPTGEPSDVTGHTETQTTVSAQTETAASTETTAGAAETESRTNPRTAAVSTSAVTTMQTAARTTATVSQGTRAVTSRSDTAPETVTTTVQRIQQADPEQVIAQLRAGYAHEFDWQGPCEIDWLPYGVAFLCRDSDLEALKAGMIGQYPVNWSEGAWTDAGGSGIGYVNGASADNCLVQPVSGFVYQYGGDNAMEMSGTGHSFSFRYDQQTQCRVMNDFSGYAREGWTVCMASVQAPICCTPGGAVYRDYTELIRALAEKPETVLLDIVYGEECSFGLPEPIIDEIYEFYVHIPDGAAVPGALSAYGTVDEMSGIPGDSYWLLETHNDFSSAYGWYGLELSDDAVQRFLSPASNEGLQQLCEELEAIPGVRLAQPVMEYYA